MMKIRTIRWTSGILILSYIIVVEVYRSIPHGHAFAKHILGFIGTGVGLLALFSIGTSWRCPSCSRYTIIFGQHCIRCGARLAPGEQEEVEGIE